jgi:hypothetical protein
MSTVLGEHGSSLHLGGEGLTEVLWGGERAKYTKF